jgi:pimeloyl-ACP methyl ester carboxylesterase
VPEPHDHGDARVDDVGVVWAGEVEPLSGPVTQPLREAIEPARIGAASRLAKHRIRLSDGHVMGLAVCGRGVPLVVVHGFSAEGILYAQTLSRLVSMGYKVVAIDTAGHGGTQGLPRGGASLEEYSELLGRAIRELGIRKAVLAGHSMGGRLVVELAANEPDLAIAVILLDAIVGDTWDRMVQLFRVAPPLMTLLGAALAADTVSTVPLFKDPRQATKLLRLALPVGAGIARHPWQLLGPSVSILRSGPSVHLLDRLSDKGVPLIAVHGDKDVAVPIATAKDAARRAHGHLVVVKDASHSWLLKDPETLPGIIYDLLGNGLGSAQRRALREAGVHPGQVSEDEVEAALYDPDALVLRLTPEPVEPQPDARRSVHPRQPRYDWTIHPPLTRV